MKRFAVLSCLIVLFVHSFTFAQNPTMRLQKILSSDNVESVDFSYYPNNLMESSYARLTDGIFRDSVYYNDLSQLTMVKQFQNVNGVWQYTGYIEFTFDANGNKITRSNYNSFDGGNTFVLGGVFNYNYDSNNKLISWNMYLGGTVLSQSAKLTYNSVGLLVEEVCEENNNGVMALSWKLEYKYDSSNNMISRTQSFVNNGVWSVYGVDKYTYDNNNNCIIWDNLIDGLIADRHEYTYDYGSSINEVVMPINPEAEFPVYVQMKNKLLTDKWSTQNESGDLVHVVDYNYTYESLLPPNSPIFTVEPNQLAINLIVGNETTSVKITNNGDVEGHFTASITGQNSAMLQLENTAQTAVVAGNSYDLIVKTVAGDWALGTYSLTLKITTDDPNNAEILIPIEVNVVEPKPIYQVSPESLLFVKTDVGEMKDTVHIANAGYAPGNVSFQIIGENAALFQLEANNQALIQVDETYPLGIIAVEEDLLEGNYYATLRITTDLDDQPTIDIPLILHVPSCNKPLSLTASVFSGSVILNWQTTGYPLSFNVYRDSELIASNITEKTYSDSNLSEGIYIYTVTSVCYVGESDFSNEYKAVIGNPTCTPIENLHYFEGFEGIYPTHCWSFHTESTSNAMEHSTTKYYEGMKSLRFSSYNQSSNYNQYLISPEIAFDKEMVVSFRYRKHTNDPEVFRVGYSSGSNDVTSADFTWTEDVTDAVPYRLEEI